ncbi:hypothetical protein S40285_09784 [Stachybotrys chlorohalonatus IBT 40285]|uniref:Uncharacterized protein n=1 Tax=Stachybotrys chlorohalonatus (strain IBT 40285) TaxID=1283841 RepID=A0A084R043_STAC4|nr:hypothetical protein S40285_09784 [Stachybotrys chlorohalonata IBT 40285]
MQLVKDMAEKTIIKGQWFWTYPATSCQVRKRH